MNNKVNKIFQRNFLTPVLPPIECKIQKHLAVRSYLHLCFGINAGFIRAAMLNKGEGSKRITLPVAACWATKPRKASMARRPFLISFSLFSSSTCHSGAVK